MLKSRRSPLGALLAVAVIAAGCDSGSDDPYADQIEKVADTDQQSAPVQSRVQRPLTVIVRSSDGELMSRVKVRWKVAPGGGAVSDSITLTDSHGRAQADYVVGATIGDHDVHAELAVNFVKYVTFTVHGTAPPAIVGVTPSSFGGGDTVTVEGSGFDASALFEVNGAPARVIDVSAATMRVVIPVCLPAGEVTLKARVNGSPSNELTGDYAAPSGSLRLAVGDYASIDPARLAGCATFPAAGAGGAEYLVAPQSLAGVQGLTADYRLVGDSVVETTVAARPVSRPATAARAFHDFLRGREVEMSRLPRPPRSAVPPASAAAVTPVKVGDERDFRVCSKVDCNLINDFVRIHARARYVGDHVAIFHDVSAPAGGFTDADLQQMGRTFNDLMYDVATRAFGVESDVDANQVVSILMTPVVNRLTPKEQCSQGIITGFFFAIDLDPAFTADLRANVGEVFYSLVADPSGSVTCTLTPDRLAHIIPATFIHEFQHMINYNQRVLVRQQPVEQIWLNEALSHLAEELGALRFLELGDQQAFSDFVIGDLYDAYHYLEAPGTEFLLYPEGTSGTLPERGASWLFARWLVDTFGPDLPRRLSETPLSGAANITNATGEPFERLLSQWFLANYVSDLPGFDAPARLRYDSWDFRTTFQSLHQQLPDAFPQPFPLAPPVHASGSFAALGTLRAGSGDYFLVTQAANQRGFTLRLTNEAGTELPANIVGRLNVIRIR